MPPGVKTVTVVMPCVTEAVHEAGNVVWKAGGHAGGEVEGVLASELRGSRGGGEQHVAVSCGSGDYSLTAQCVV
jgi:hypothetical protein